MYRRNNAPRSHRPMQSHGMMEQSYGSNMSDRTDALMSRPSPFGNDGPFTTDRQFGADRSFDNDRNFANDRPAPFASESNMHLQELDLELALLKRKRQIIEQQQMLLGNNDSYSRQQSNYSADNTPALMQNYTNKFYNDRPASGHKRRGEGPWQESSRPKRFSGPQNRRSPNRNGPARGQNRSFNRPKPAKAAIRMPESKPQPRPSRPKEPSSRPSAAAPTRGRNFNPTRVTKPKNANSSAKPLSTYPVAKRKEFVAKASNLVKNDTEKEEDFLLTADKPPTPRMVGRLELALGVIFKDIHKLHPENAAPLQYLVIRNIKQTIRDRIREVMVGKVVGRHDDIVKTYRAKYGAETDKEVLATAASKPEPARKRKFIDSESPGKYFKTNFGMLLNKKLNEMFDKLKEVYNKHDLRESIKQTLEEMQNEDIEKQAEAEAAEKAAAEKDFTADVEVDAEATKETKEGDEAEVKDPEEKKDEQGAEEKKPEERRGYRSKYYERLMEDLLRMQLVDVLPKYKEKIISLLDIDEEYKKTKASIIMKSEEIAKHLSDEVKALEDTDVKIVFREIRDADAKVAAEKRASRSPLLFVKIMGRPFLPKRHLMQDFLDQFSPRAIKRHRNMKNVLFVGFEGQEDFDRIQAASQTVVGTCTLEIKVSDRTRQANKAKIEGTPKKDGKELDTELDNQIDDLLTSIREEEEKHSIADEDEKHSVGDEEEKQSAPDAEKTEETEENAEENAEGTDADKTDAWENGDGTWDAENNVGTWDTAEGETDENKPEEANDVEFVEGENGEHKETDDVVLVENDNAAEPANDVVEIKDEESEPPKTATSTPGRINTRRSTRRGK